MADGWTGLDLGKIRTQLNNFDEIMSDAISDYETAYYIFNRDLYNMWASPKAVEFNGILSELAYEIVRLKKCRYEVMYGAVKAAQYMAQRNGATFEYDVPEVDEYYEVASLELDKDGIAGMNIPLAKLALETFTESVTKAVGKIDSLSMDFALYDPNGELIRAYIARVQKAKDEISNYLNMATDKLTTAFEEEEMQIVMGKQQAQTALA